MELTENADIDTLTYTGKEPCIYWRKRGFGVRVYATGPRSTFSLTGHRAESDC